MNVLSLLFVMLAPALIAVYTFNYARWAWRQQLRRGAVGLFVLAAATIIVPASAIWWTSQ